MNSSGFPFSCFLWLLSRSLSNLHLLWAFNYTWRAKECGFWRKKKLHLNSSSATKSHGVEPSLVIFSACPLLPSSVPGAWPPKAQQQAALLLGCQLGLPTQRHEMEPEEEKNYNGGHCFPLLLASRSGGGYVPLAHSSCSCGYLIFSGSSVRGVQITPFSPRVPAWCLSTQTDSPNAAHHPVYSSFCRDWQMRQL